jgi:hypothetical protein
VKAILRSGGNLRWRFYIVEVVTERKQVIYISWCVLHDSSAIIYIHQVDMLPTVTEQNFFAIRTESNMC